jgi:hypothetical protein
MKSCRWGGKKKEHAQTLAVTEAETEAPTASARTVHTARDSRSVPVKHSTFPESDIL